MNGGGEFGDEGSVTEAVRAIRDFAGAVEDYDRGEGVDAEEAVEAVGENGGGARLDFVEIRSDESFVIIAIGGEEEDAGVVAKFSGDFFKKGFKGAAGATPGGPEIHHKDFSFLRSERIGIARRDFAKYELERIFCGRVASLPGD